MSQLEFDEETGRRLEALYRIEDSVRRRTLVRSALGAAPGERILDVGCGPGFYCAELVGEVGTTGAVVGLDGSTQMLRLATQRCAGHENVRFAEADATALPVDDAAFDAAICVQVLEYVDDVPAALAELHRTLRPGGRVVVWDIDWATLSWHSRDSDRMARLLRAWDEHLVHPSLPRTLAPALRAAGFEQVAMEAHAFASIAWDPGCYGVAALPLIASFVAGRGGVGAEEADAWAAEQRALGDQGAFSFAFLQFCFTGTRPV